jgi:hypothetical protein
MQMSKKDNDITTDIVVVASNNDVVALLKNQYGHLEKGEARTLLEQTPTLVWSNDELLETFEVSHFAPPYVHVIRKEDGQRGTVMFLDDPRLYFSFSTEDENE